MAYQYGVGGTSPAASPLQRSRTPVGAMSPPQGQIQPGSITYTTTTGPDGQITYHPFRAVAASYQTPQGLVSGIQWIPAEATQVLPSGAMPADDQFRASFSRSGADDRWQDEDRRRRKEDEREYRREEKERRRQEKEEERELRRAREREDRERERRRNSGYGYEGLDRQFGDMSVKDRSYGAAAGYTAPAGYPPAGQYGTAGYGAPAAPRPVSPYHGQTIAPRPVSPYAAPGVNPRAPSPYGGPPRAPSPYAPPPRAPSPYAAPGGIGRAASPSPYGAAGAGIGRAASPYAAAAAALVRSTSPYQAGGPPAVYPPGHIMEGRPIPQGGRPISRAASPVPGYAAGAGSGYATPAPPGQYSYGNQGAQQGGYGSVVPGGGQYAVAPYPGGASPVMPTAGGGEQPMLSAPEGFSRPPNLGLSYPRFDPFKIQDMDEFYVNIPRMPAVLQPHDVYHEDWIRLMTDLALAWSGKLPVPEYAQDGRPPKRTVLTSDLIDLWNVSFFFRRGVEIVLFKGRERRSGPQNGQVELHLPGFDDISAPSDSSSSEDSSSDDDDDDDRGRYGAYGNAYGRQVSSQIAEMAEARRARREKKKAEKKRRRQEKKQRRKQKEAERNYALYITCVSREA